MTTPNISMDFALAIRPSGIILRSTHDPMLILTMSFRSSHHPITIHRYLGKELMGAKSDGSVACPDETTLWSTLEGLGASPVSSLRAQDTIYAQAIARRAELALTCSPTDFTGRQQAFEDKLATIHQEVLAAVVSQAGAVHRGRGRATPTFPQYKAIAYWLTRAKVMLPEVGATSLMVRTLPGPFEGCGWHVGMEVDTQNYRAAPNLQRAFRVAADNLACKGIEVTPYALQGVNFRL